MAYGALDPNFILSLGLRPPTQFQGSPLSDPNTYQGWGAGSMPLFYDIQNPPYGGQTIQPAQQPFTYDPFGQGPISTPNTPYPQTPPGFGIGPPIQGGPTQEIGIQGQPPQQEQMQGMQEAPMPNFPQYDPLGMGLTQFGLALMRASGPSPYKNGLLHAIGQAGPEGLSAFTGMNQLNFQNQNKAKELQILEEGRRAQALQRTAQTQALQEQVQAKQRMRQLLNALAEAKTPEERRTILAEMYPDKAYEAELKQQAVRTVLSPGQEIHGADGELIAKGPPKDPAAPKVEEFGVGKDMFQKKQWNEKTGQWDAQGEPYKKGALVENKIDLGNAKELGKNVLAKLDASDTIAQTAVQNKGNIDRMGALLNDPKVIAGYGAKARLKGAQILNILSGGKEDQLGKTRELVQGLAELAVQSRQLMKGSGSISENEQRLLEQARSGNFEMTIPELKALLGVFNRQAKAAYDQHARNYERARKMPGTENQGIEFYEPPENPWANTSADGQPKGPPTGRY